MGKLKPNKQQNIYLARIRRYGANDFVLVKAYNEKIAKQKVLERFEPHGYSERSIEILETIE